MLRSAGLGCILGNRAVQRTCNYCVTQRVLHFRDLYSTKGKLLHIGRRYIKCIAGITGGEIVAAIHASAVGIGGKIPSSCRLATPIVVGEVFPLKDCAGKGAIALRCSGVFIHFGQHKGRVKNGNIGYGD